MYCKIKQQLISTRDRKNVPDVIVIYRMEKKFWKRRLILSSRIVLEARIYELRIHIFEKAQTLSNILKAACRDSNSTKIFLCYPPSRSSFFLFQPPNCLACRNAMCSFVFVVSHGRRRARNVAHRSFASTVNNGIFVFATASISYLAAWNRGPSRTLRKIILIYLQMTFRHLCL